jgi:hypothetical protein
MPSLNSASCNLTDTESYWPRQHLYRGKDLALGFFGVPITPPSNAFQFLTFLFGKPMSTAEHETIPQPRLILAPSARFTIDPERQATLETACSPQVRVDNAPESTSASVSLTSLPTLVCRGKGSMPGTSYVVPTFAIHWGVVVRTTLFHLLYYSKSKTVQFNWHTWEPKDGDSRYEITKVGHQNWYFVV